MHEVLQEIRMHFNIVWNEKEESVGLTLINPNITVQTMNLIKDHLALVEGLKKLQIVLIQCPNFDDQLLTVLAQGIPRSLTEIMLDFSGQHISQLVAKALGDKDFYGLALKKLSIDLGSVFDINDIVVEGLALLLSNLSQLEQLYLDFYQIDKITQDGYLLLMEAISDLHDLKKFSIDLSANANISEDVLEMLFVGLSQKLEDFRFKILDTDHIGGGSFFKLGELLQQMKQLKSLQLTISTFTNLNQKGIYSILKGISKISSLETLKLNLSNIDMPEKMITHLQLGPKLATLQLDLSCNRKITFGDFINLGTKITKVTKITLNLDFCTGINEDAIQQVIEMIANSNKCISLNFTDRNYSIQFQSSIAQKLVEMRSLLNVEISHKIESKRLNKLRKIMTSKKHFIEVCIMSKVNKLPQNVSKDVLELLFQGGC